MKNLSNLSMITILTLVITFSIGCTKTDDPNNPISTTTVKDIDGNVYHTVKIGTQTWMVENLKTTKYRNGDAIPNVTDATAWSKLTTGACCNYNNDITIGTKYGKLYNWYAVTDSRSIAPTGWHVPTDVEWTTLENYASANLGTSGSVAKVLAATTDWAASTNAGAIGNDLSKNNSSGFSALPGGNRSYGFENVGINGNWWSATKSSDRGAWYLHLYDSYVFNYDGRADDLFETSGFSVRCIKDYEALAAVETSETLPTSPTTATGGGKITDVGGVGGAPVTARGVCWATTENPTITNNKTTNGNGSGTFTSAITGLTPETTYYVRAYATNSVGTTYGTQKSFSTKLPTITTKNASFVTSTSLICGGTITDIGGGKTIIESGICWDTNQNPTIVNSKLQNGNAMEYTDSLGALKPNTTYYIRAFAKSNIGVGYGNAVTVNTPDIMTDNDGNIYNCIIIGTQTWTIENLKTTKYRDGSAIPLVADATAWIKLSTSGYCWYDNDITNKNKFGALYNWFAVNTGKLVPVGWHIANEINWTTLAKFINNSACSLASKTDWGKSYFWNTPGNILLINNSSGFNGIPAGFRYNVDGSFNAKGYNAIWWSSTEYDVKNAWNMGLNNEGETVMWYYSDKQEGISVRCVKD